MNKLLPTIFYLLYLPVSFTEVSPESKEKPKSNPPRTSSKTTARTSDKKDEEVKNDKEKKRWESNFFRVLGYLLYC
ncbi:MAG: hypothetical protein QM669_14015 [Siphonobacter sp.]